MGLIEVMETQFAGIDKAFRGEVTPKPLSLESYWNPSSDFSGFVSQLMVLYGEGWKVMSSGESEAGRPEVHIFESLSRLSQRLLGQRESGDYRASGVSWRNFSFGNIEQELRMVPGLRLYSAKHGDKVRTSLGFSTDKFVESIAVVQADGDCFSESIWLLDQISINREVWKTFYLGHLVQGANREIIEKYH